MPPYHVPHAPGSGNTPQAGGSNDPANIHAGQERQHLENRLRIKKGEVQSRERELHEVEREITTLENEIHHEAEDEKRIGEEVRHMSQEVKQGEGVSKRAEMGMRDKDQELHRKDDETKKLEHEIEALKMQIAEKERAIAEVKESVRGLMKEREDLRRTHELEHFTVKAGGEHEHDKQLKLHQIEQEKSRKEAELARKHERMTALKHDINMKEQDVMQLESELQHLGARH